MKREISPPSRGLLILYRIFVALILALVLILAAGGIYALVRPADSAPLLRIGGAGQSGAGQGTRPVNEATAVFSGLGRLRIPIAGQPPATLVLSISFPYPPDDRAFTEELASRIGEFRSIAIAYFASLPPGKIAGLDEDAAKADILRQYNALLRLGRIETLYFGDLMVVE